MIAGAALVTTLFGTGSAAFANNVPAVQTTAAQETTVTTAPATATATTTTTADQTAAAEQTTALATEAEQTVLASAELPEVTLTPDKLFYALKLWIEQIQLAFTIDAAERAILLEQQAQTRLAEAKAMAEAGKADLAKQAMDEAKAKLEEAQGAIEAAAKANKDLTKLTAQVEANEAKFTAALQTMVETAPEEVKTQVEPVIANLLVQVAANEDAAKKDGTAREEAEKLVAAQAELKAELEKLQPRMVLVLNAMSEASGKSLADVLAMYKENPGLGRIAKELGLKMGAVQHAAQIKWMAVNKDGEIKIELTTAPSTEAAATSTEPAKATKAELKIKVEDEDEDEDEVEIEIEVDDDDDDDKKSWNRGPKFQPPGLVMLGKLKQDDKDDHKDHGRGHDKGKGHGKGRD